MNWVWSRATGSDIVEIVAMAVDDFESEVLDIWIPDHTAYARNVTQAVVAQFYGPDQELLMVARRDGELVGYVWACRQTAPWSDEPMAAVRMIHVDLSMSRRERLRLITQMLGLVEVWSVESCIPIVCSTTMRRDITGFMRLHESLGYDVRGSIAYKRLSTTQATPANSLDPS